MKLIRCYIENFGGLSRYSLDFAPGVTTVEEANGFGKTTLAEFIRAMFYGFPRASKTLEKNLRKKYHPWQGGKFGGSLVFELEGRRYRIERTFGLTPRSDTFVLYDEETNRKSDRFSQDIGLELFQLDADSFERSTYLPQLHEGTSLTTDSIRAKLGDLVEDTGDVNNFEKALAALKAKRSSFIPYRGSGGSVAAAQEKISALQTVLDESRPLRGQLEELLEKAAGLERQKEHREQDLRSLREKITRTSEAAARSTLTKQYEALLQERSRADKQLRALLARYPGGLPAQEELEDLLPLFDQAAALSGATGATEADETDRALLAEYADRFDGGVPTEEAFRTCAEEIQGYIAADSALAACGLSSQEQVQFSTLKQRLAPGIPEEALLEEAQQDAARLSQLESQAQHLIISPEDLHRKAQLEQFFSSDVPSEQEMRTQQSAWARIGTLRQESARLAAAPADAAPEASPAPTGSKAFLPVLLLGLLALGGGIVLLSRDALALGGGLIGLGAVALIGAAYLRLKQMVSHTPAPTGSPFAQQIRRNEAEAQQLETDLIAFLGRFPGLSSAPGQALTELAANRADFLALTERLDALTRQQQTLEADLAALRNALQARLGPWQADGTPFADTVLELRLARTQFLSLQQKAAQAQAQAQQLQQELASLSQSITAFLRPYAGDVAPEAFSSALSALERACDAWTKAADRQTERAARETQRAEALRQCEEALRSFAQPYQLTLTVQDRALWQTLRDDARNRAALSDRRSDLESQITAFTQAHPVVLEPAAQEPPADPEELKGLESVLQSELTALSHEILALRSRCRTLQATVDAIPAREDELEHWKIQKAEDQKKCALLDETIDYLQRAQESLARQYLGPVQQNFATYLRRLTGRDSDRVFVNSDLEVSVERLGQARELGYFSAGQADLVALCMRFALVDALFKNTRPLLILDDPFVNLDDAHMEKALALLRELGEDHQILYLVCNSSRT